MDLFYLSKYENNYVLTHRDSPGLEVCVNGDTNSDLSLEDIKRFAVSQFVIASGEELREYVLSNRDNIDFYDECWMDGKLCRKDYSQGSKEGQEILLRLQDEFPDETIYDESKPKNMISQYVSDRSDYPNEIFHYYDFKEPSTTTKTRFGLSKYDNFDAFGWDWNSYPEEVIKSKGENDLSALIGLESPLQSSWYAYKFDRTTKEVKCKIVLPKTQMTSETQEAVYKAIPEEFVRINSTFFAKLHNADKSESKEIDVYFVTIPYIVDLFCEQEGLTYPYGKYGEKKDLEEKTHVWGAIYDEETEKFKHIKGYARFYK